METAILNNRDTFYKVGSLFVFTEIKEIRNLKNVEAFVKMLLFTQNALNHDKSDID